MTVSLVAGLGAGDRRPSSGKNNDDSKGRSAVRGGHYETASYQESRHNLPCARSSEEEAVSRIPSRADRSNTEEDLLSHEDWQTAAQRPAGPLGKDILL